MKLLLAIILTTLMGCTFASTTIGSFIGHLGAELVHEEMEEKNKKKDIHDGEVLLQISKEYIAKDKCLNDCI